MVTPISISQLEAAINAARRDAPSSGNESTLATDVSLMADVYGELICLGHTGFDANSVNERTGEALSQWTRLNQMSLATGAPVETVAEQDSVFRAFGSKGS